MFFYFLRRISVNSDNIKHKKFSESLNKQNFSTSTPAVMWELDFLLNIENRAVQKSVAFYKKKKSDLDKQYKMLEPNSKVINSLKTNISYHKKKLIKYQIADKLGFDNSYCDGVVWKLDFLLCNQAHFIKADIFQYTKERIELRALEQEKKKKIKIINRFKVSIKACRRRLVNYQINTDTHFLPKY